MWHTYVIHNTYNNKKPWSPIAQCGDACLLFQYPQGQGRIAEFVALRAACQQGLLVRSCSNSNHLNPTLYVGMPVAPGSCSQDQEPRVQPSDFLLRLLCLLTPWPWKHKCVLDEGLVMEKLGQCVSTTLCRLFYIILHKDLTPRSCLFQMSYCPVRVKTRWLLPGWDRDSDWVGPQDEKGDGSGHQNISKTLTCPKGKDIICLFHKMYHKGLAMYNSCNKTRVHRKCVWNPQCNILNLKSPSGETGCLSAVCYFPGPVHEVISWPSP